MKRRIVVLAALLIVGVGVFAAHANEIKYYGHVTEVLTPKPFSHDPPVAKVGDRFVVTLNVDPNFVPINNGSGFYAGADEGDQYLGINFSVRIDSGFQSFLPPSYAIVDIGNDLPGDTYRLFGEDGGFFDLLLDLRDPSGQALTSVDWTGNLQRRLWPDITVSVEDFGRKYNVGFTGQVPESGPTIVLLAFSLAALAVMRLQLGRQKRT